MRRRRLGRTGIEVSEVGFGAWGIGGSMWLGVDDEEGKAALREALELGVSFVDTALAYGDGHSERVIAAVLEEPGRRDQVAVATKIPPKDYVWPGKEATPFRDVFPAAWVVKCVEESLGNLRAEALHLEQFHVWHDAWLASPEWDKTRTAMERLTREGKVLHWGISINDHAPGTALTVLSDPLLESAQVIYNVFDRSPERELFALAREKDLGIIVRVPFDEGALTGAVRPDTEFPPRDWRHRYFRGERKAEAARRADALKALLGEEAKTLPELALRFVLSRPEVSTVIPGMRRPGHARANASVSDGRGLTPSLLARLTPHAWEKNWY
ncbi:MAG: aldo/keto reductase [Acidobacteriia bacterium]|nr:aldo/keto reductase [Terriglobia bacterium]